jgi:hypothetical protein
MVEASGSLLLLEEVDSAAADERTGDSFLPSGARGLVRPG